MLLFRYSSIQLKNERTTCGHKSLAHIAIHKFTYLISDEDYPHEIGEGIGKWFNGLTV